MSNRLVNLLKIFVLIAFITVCGVSTVILLKGCELWIPAGFEKITEGNFIICADKNDIQSYKGLGTKLSNFLDLLKKDFANLELMQPEQNIKILIFKNEDDFRKFGLTTTHHDFVYNSGFYNPNRWEIALIDSKDLVDTFQGLKHELVHLLMDRSFYNPQWPSWLAEGLAMYFEEHPNWKVIDLAKLAISQGIFIPVRSLIKADQRAFQSAANLIYYYESYLLVSFLLEKKPDAFYKYYKEESKPYKYPDKFLELFGEIEYDFLEYIKKL